MADMIVSAAGEADFVVDTTLWAPSSNLTFCNKEGTLEWSPAWFATYKCGDANGDREITTADPFHILNYLGAGPAVSSCWAANVNGDSNLTSGDGFHLLNYFGGGPALQCAPCESRGEEDKQIVVPHAPKVAE